MKHGILLLIVLWAPTVWGQNIIERRAQRMMESGQFAEAFPLWVGLSDRAGADANLRGRYAREAARSAMASGKYADALNWNAELFRADSISFEDVCRQVDLMRLNRLEFRIPTFLAAPFLRGIPTDSLTRLLEDHERILEISQDSIAYSVTRFRPGAARPEFAAMPRGKGLIFQSVSPADGISPQRDGVTGEAFSHLMFLPDTADPQPNYSWLELLQGAEWFSDFEQTATHNGPIAFNAADSWAVVTRNQADADSTREIPLEQLKLDLYKKTFQGWIQTVGFPWNSTSYSTGHGCFDLDGNLIFMSDMPGGYGGMDLYRSDWSDEDGWLVPVNLGLAVNTPGDESFPFMSDAGFLYFSSDGREGLGGMDVYAFDEVTNHTEHLGTPINSCADDFAFVMDELEGIGYLSSNRDSGVDAIYRVQGAPLGAKIEFMVQSCDGSPLAGAKVRVKDELAGRVVVLTMDESGEGTMSGWRDRFYEMSVLPFSGMNAPPSIRMRLDSVATKVDLDMNHASKQNSLVVFDELGAPAANVLLTFKDARGGESNFLTDSEGRFEWNAPSQEEDYVEVSTTLINYNDQHHVFAEPPPGCLTSISDTLYLEPWDGVLERIDLASILYDLGSSALREESMKELDKVANYLNEHPQVRVELSSHTDCRNDEQHNLELSQARADACVDYIIAKGVDSLRILAIGYGESRLLNSCSDATACGCAPAEVVCEPCSEELHQQNRRTELQLLAD